MNIYLYKRQGQVVFKPRLALWLISISSLTVHLTHRLAGSLVLLPAQHCPLLGAFALAAPSARNAHPALHGAGPSYPGGSLLTTLPKIGNLSCHTPVYYIECSAYRSLKWFMVTSQGAPLEQVLGLSYSLRFQTPTIVHGGKYVLNEYRLSE